MSLHSPYSGERGDFVTLKITFIELYSTVIRIITGVRLPKYRAVIGTDDIGPIFGSCADNCR